MTIRNKLTLRFFLLVLGIIGVASIVIYIFSERHRKEDFYIRLRNKAEATAKLLISVDEMNVELLHKIEKDNPMTLPAEGIVVWNYKNHVLFDTDKKGIIKQNSSLLNQIRLEGEVRMENGDYEILGFLFTDKYDRFVVLAAAKDIYGKNRIKDLKWVMVTVFGFSLGFIILAGWFYAGRALLPISIIIDKVKQIKISSLNLRLEEGNKVDELSKLSQTFNNMLARLEEGVKIQKDFIANASHEMRTPLTAMTGQLEVALMKQRTAEKYKEVLESVLEDIKNLNKTSNRLLLLAQANTENLELEMEEIRIDDLVWQSREELLKLQPNYEVIVDLDMNPEYENQLQILGNSQLIKTAIINLIENGCKYSLNHKAVLTLKTEKSGLKIMISESGIGIPDKDLDHIFQPFYRASNSTSARGHGIGLSLVQKIVQIHKGTIQVKSKLGEGTIFTIVFPVL
jgi:signal transduction histidine kinase